MKKLWIAFALVMGISFSVLGWIGTRIYQEKPPIPSRVITGTGEVLVADGAIERGQNVWQSMGGMEVGSIWGHGSYVAPDWTADWLHRELTFVLDEWSREQYGRDYNSLRAEDQAGLRGRLVQMFRANTYDPATGTIIVDPIRARAFAANLAHYSDVFLNGNADYSIPAGTIRSEDRVRDMAAFFFWTAWAAGTNRPGANLSYTHNWPHEALIGNQPSGDMLMWTGVSIIMLLAGICAMVWWQAAQESKEAPLDLPATTLSAAGKQPHHRKLRSNTSGLFPRSSWCRCWRASSRRITGWKATDSTDSIWPKSCLTQ
jgi:nitric oxide reductase subunit B